MDRVGSLTGWDYKEVINLSRNDSKKFLKNQPISNFVIAEANSSSNIVNHISLLTLQGTQSLHICLTTTQQFPC